MLPSRFQVVVIGGGHAGVEAAWAAANLLGPDHAGPTVALITQDPAKIGVMSCNPANGGLAKGQLVREIDAMGGVMGLATDAAGIQFKVLNTSKGPAVWGPRAQCDKDAYAAAVQAMLASRPEIQIIAGTVDDLIVTGSGDDRRITGVAVTSPPSPSPIIIHASAVVLTTGTFMRAMMHTGLTQTPGGRHGEAPATGIAAALKRLGFELGRLKTGTPPRLSRATIDWDSLPAQHGDDTPTPFSDLSGAQTDPPSPAFPSLSRFPVLPQVECRVTSTTPAMHDLIRANLDRAPMFSGQIEGVGPRYCPSIEDKVVRFADRDSHTIFLEPETLGGDWVYCNGISTSLPADVQEPLVRSMPGCASARILRMGYAVEYDMVRPHQIHATGMTKSITGLFLAGQINGTSGYEEAAAQGLVAGINAALLVRDSTPDSAWRPARDDGYLGVLMDDLVTKTPVEPYRMFTSRAEHRLLLRADNAADRLTPITQNLGLLSHHTLGQARVARHERRKAQLAHASTAIEAARVSGEPLARHMARPEFTVDDLDRALTAGGHVFDRATLLTLLADRQYAGFITRQRAEIKRQADLERRRLPARLNVAHLPGLRAEARLALARFRPETFGQAGRLEGITPADLTILAVLARKGS